MSTDMSEQSTEALRSRAVRYREMAKTATTHAAAESLRRLAESFEALASKRDSDPETP